MDEKQQELYAKREIKRAEIEAQLSERGIGSAKRFQLQDQLRKLNQMQFELLSAAIERSDGPERALLEVRREEITKRLGVKSSPVTASAKSLAKASPTKRTPRASTVEFGDSPPVTGVSSPGEPLGPRPEADTTPQHTTSVDRSGNISVQSTGRGGRGGRGRGRGRARGRLGLTSTQLLTAAARGKVKDRGAQRDAFSQWQSQAIAGSTVSDIIDRAVETAQSASAGTGVGDSAPPDADIEKLFGPSGTPPSTEAIDEQYRERLASIRSGALERAREREAQDAARSDFERDRAFREGRSTGYAEGQASTAVNELGEFAQSISKQLTSATDGMDALAKVSSKLDGASSEVRIDLLQELQRNPQLQDLVKAGLMRWDDIMIKNPPATDSNHVSNPDGDDPQYVIDRKKLVDLQRKLADYKAKQTATLSNVQETVARRRTTPGVVPSARDAIYPGLKVWTPAAWAPALKPGAS